MAPNHLLTMGKKYETKINEERSASPVVPFVVQRVVFQAITQHNTDCGASFYETHSLLPLNTDSECVCMAHGKGLWLLTHYHSLSYVTPQQR